jgi:hypothetical protein
LTLEVFACTGICMRIPEVFERTDFAAAKVSRFTDDDGCSYQA